MTVLFGGVFDPPHNGHVALARAAAERFAPDELVVLVTASPAHKPAWLDSHTRLRLARAAFPEHDVQLDPHGRTVDLLRNGRWRDPTFVVGADEFSDFLDWKEPERVLELARVAVATRPGYRRERLDDVLHRLRRRDRVEFFDVEPLAIASRDMRVRIARGEPIDGLVPPAVARLVHELGLYRS